LAFYRISGDGRRRGCSDHFPARIRKSRESGKALQDKIQRYREEFANPYRAAEHLHVDDVIDPAETRLKLIAALEMVINKQEDRPAKKHGIMPT